jgi:hypothetical protein
MVHNLRVNAVASDETKQRTVLNLVERWKPDWLNPFWRSSTVRCSDKFAGEKILEISIGTRAAIHSSYTP